MSAVLQHATRRATASLRLRAAWRSAFLLGFVPGLFLFLLLDISYHRGMAGAWAIDFNGNLRTPAQEILAGVSPYHPGELVRVREAVAAGASPSDFQRGVFAAYPPPALLLGVPFTLLPAGLAEWLWMLCTLASGALALRLAGVRDWRVYGACGFMLPVATSLMLGSLDLPLMLGLAACWRWRDRAGRAGCALGALIALKLLALPLIVWFIATRRFRAAGVALASAAALIGGAWAAIGFDGLRGYPHLLSLLTDVESRRGYSVVHDAARLGLGNRAASAAPYAVGCALLLALFAAARGGRQADAKMFLFGVLAILAFSPIVWQHYLVLVLVPLAVLQPVFSRIWLVPSLLWLTPDSSNVARPRELAMFALVLAAVSARGLWHARMREAAAAPPAPPMIAAAA